MEKINEIKAGITAAIAALTALWGWYGWLVIAWVFCMALDFGTGTAAAMRAGDWHSGTARDGLWHKLGCIVAVGAASVADAVIGAIINHLPGITLPFSYTVLIAPVVVVWYILTELGSILENAVALGANVPEFLQRILRVGMDAVDAAGDKLTGKEDK